MPMDFRILMPMGIRNRIMRCHSIKAASTDFGWNRIDQKQRFSPCDMIQGSVAHLGFRGCALYNNIYLRFHIGMYAVAIDVRYDLHGVYVDYILPASAADLSFWPRLPACRKVWSKENSTFDYINKRECTSPGLTWSHLMTGSGAQMSPTSMLNIRSEMLPRCRQEGGRRGLCHSNDKSSFVVI